MNMRFILARGYFYHLVVGLCLLGMIGCTDEGKDSPKTQKIVKNKIVAQKIESKQEKKLETAEPVKPAIAPEPKPEAAAAGLKVEDLSIGQDEDRYNPVGKVDPFAPLFANKVAEQEEVQKKKKRLALTPLEKVDISQLRLVGVIRSQDGNKALVEEATGKGYIVTTGAYVGLNSGTVVKILKDRIIIEEKVENIMGKISVQERELKIQKPTGE